MRIRWRNLELPSRVVVERDSLTETFGKFVVEPFERGVAIAGATALLLVTIAVWSRRGEGGSPAMRRGDASG